MLAIDWDVHVCLKKAILTQITHKLFDLTDILNSHNDYWTLNFSEY